MAKYNHIQTNFTAGEIAPIMKGRIDIVRYNNGVARQENFISRPQGGAERRTGTIFVNEVKDQSKYTRLQRFEFSTVQAYILEFSEGIMRVYRDGGIVLDPINPVEVVTPYLESELKELSFAQSADVLYICHENHQTRTLSRTSHTNWTLGLYAPKDGPYLPVNTTDNTMKLTNIVDRITLKSTENDFAAGDVGNYVEYQREGETVIGKVITFVSADEIVIEPYLNIIAELEDEITVTSAVVPTLIATADTFVRSNVGSYIKAVGATDAWHEITDYDGATRDRVTIGAALTMVTPIVGGTYSTENHVVTADCTATESIFASTDVGRMIRFNFTGEQVWGTITAYTSATEVAVSLDRSMPLKPFNSGEIRDDGESKLWRLGAWSDTTGWPAAVVFHEGRLVFANSSEEPQSLWMTKSGDYLRFDPTEDDSSVLDDNGITVTIASKRVNSILWLESGPVLLIGTVGAEWQIRSSTLTEPITPSNISATEQTAHGSKRVAPSRIGSAVIFLQRAGTKLRELIYDFNIDAHVARDLTIISEHILRDGGGGADLEYQQEPYSIIWVAREDGELAALTYVRDQEVFAWHRHIVGGTDAVVESIASVPSIDTTEETLYMVVRRTINGSTTRYVERLSDRFSPEDENDKDNMVFVDSALNYTGVPATVMSGLDHLEGEEVEILADGSAQPSQTVSGGQVTLDTPASTVWIGLSYRSLIQTLPPEGGGDSGTAQGKTKRIKRIAFRLLNSLGFQHGEEEDELTEQSFRDAYDAMDDSPPLFTGDIEVDLDHDYETDGDYFIVKSDPYPLTIVALMPELRVRE